MFRIRNEILLKKIHRILKFKQKDWIKSYIDFNAQKRKEATNDADENLFKLLNNAAYGKAMENLRKIVRLSIAKNEKCIAKHISKPSYISQKMFDKNLVAIHEKKICLTLNKPIYVAFTVLEISRWEMYNFRYNFIIKKFNTKLLFTDTDSLCYEIHGKNPHKKIDKYQGLFDLSNYTKSSE